MTGCPREFCNAVLESLRRRNKSYWQLPVNNLRSDPVQTDGGSVAVVSDRQAEMSFVINEHQATVADDKLDVVAQFSAGCFWGNDKSQRVSNRNKQVAVARIGRCSDQPSFTRIHLAPGVDDKRFSSAGVALQKYGDFFLPTIIKAVKDGGNDFCPGNR